MNYDEFRNILRENLEYKTSPEFLKLAKKKFLYKFNLWYYINIVKSIARCYKYSKRNEFDIERFAIQSHEFLQQVEDCGVAVNIEGLENLKIMKEQGCVLVANHMSMLETFILPSMFLPFGKATYILKESLLKYPLLKNALHAIEPISVKRENARDDLKKVLTEGVVKLKDGVSVVIFPQSTRDVAFEKSKFNTLGHKLAAKVNAPIIPVALKTDFYSRGRIFKDLGHLDRTKPVHVKFGKPIFDVSQNRQRAYEEAFQFIAKTYQSWGGQVKANEII